MSVSRRSLVRGAASALSAGTMPASIARALAMPALGRSKSLLDVEHVVILMQENRSFDHYFGTLAGVRGYADRITPELSEGRTIWQQRNQDGKMIMPFALNGQLSDAQHVTSLPHSWPDQHAAWNQGRMDHWIPAKGEMTMSHFTAAELPFHVALANAFTICDAYFSSIPGSTCPNRAHLMTGMIDPHGQYGGPMVLQPIVDKEFMLAGGPRYSWKTFPERLEEAGISWRIYQGQDDNSPFEKAPQDEIHWAKALGRDDPQGIVSCYNIMYFFQQYANAPVGSALYEKAMTRRTPKDFAEDLKAGRLPQVSWLMPPYEHSEHPRRSPANGAAYIETILDALTSTPEVWGKTAFFIVYDENDGYFDHVLPPAPPGREAEGASNIPVHDDIYRDGLPIGLGFRVPALVVSPWSKGGVVCSQVFDHTSVIRFLEQRFGVFEPNISQWRREICGDLTSAFDFSLSNHKPISLPATNSYIAYSKRQKLLPEAQPPATFAPPQQAKGTRLSRALPYHLAVEAVCENQTLQVSLVNSGDVGAVFYAYEEDIAPKRYSVARNTVLTASFPFNQTGGYNLKFIGPNGFMRHFKGTDQAVIPSLSQKPAMHEMTIFLQNPSLQTVIFTVTDNRYGQKQRSISLLPGASHQEVYSANRTYGWYDLTISSAKNELHAAGRLENGKLSVSDPAWS